MKEFLKRICANSAFCFSFAVKWTGVFFTLWGVITLFVPSDELIDSNLPWGIRLLFAVLFVAAVFAVAYIIGIVMAFHTNQVELLSVGNNHHVYVQYGDALSLEVVGDGVQSQKRNVLISVNRCFDTIVDDDLISSQSLHGQVMKNLYANGEYTEDTLNEQIQRKLANQPFTSVSREDKPRGNLKRYAEGTVAEIESSSGCTYFFLGLTSFDEMLHPYISDVEYGVALVKALQYCFNRNQGYPVVFPLIGGGRAQTRKGEKDILEFVAKLIQMNKLAINCDIHIVVRESAKDSISILKLTRGKG